MIYVQLVYFLKITGSLISLIPIAVGIYKYHNLNYFCRTFLFFLIYGFLVDASVWFYKDIAKPISYFTYNSYSLIESIYFFWFISLTTNSPVLQKIKWKPVIILLPFWTIAHYVINEPNKPSSIFDTTYLIAISFLSGFAILKFIEKESKSNQVYFSIMLGIFINTFGTFFTSSLLETELRHRLWFLQNIINIIAYLIFTKAFLESKTQKLSH
jgi:hypothetical protein